MKIMVSSGPAEPLYFPVVPLAWALRSAGHEVLVATPANFGPRVKLSGLASAPVCGPLEMPEVMIRDRAGRPIELPDNDADAIAGIGRGFGRLAARTVEGFASLVDRWRPDLVIAESHSYSAAVVAEARGIPWVRHGLGPGDDYLAEVDRWAVEEFGGEMRELGVTELPRADLVLNTCPPALLNDKVEPGRPMRYLPYAEQDILPDWVLEPRARPRLLVTLGTVEPVAFGGLKLFEQLMRTLPTLDVEIVLAAAEEVVAGLGPLPDSVIAAGWIPLASALPTCDVVVHHGGPGTTMNCLHNGLPQLIIPGMAKPHDSVKRLTSFGAAEHIQSSEVTPEAVLESCRALFEDGSYREHAVRLREQIAAQPSPYELVPTVEDLVLKTATK